MSSHFSIILLKYIIEWAAIADLTWRLLDCSPTGTGRGAGESVTGLDEELNRRVYELFGLSPEEIGIVEGTKG
jgi:hypothetical protein